MRWIDPSELDDLLSPGMRVYVAGSSGEPHGLVAALQRNPGAARGVTFVQFPLPGINTVDFSSLAPDARAEVFFVTPDLREGFQAGRVQYIPMQMRGVYDYLATCAPFDYAFLRVAAGEANGTYALAPNSDFVEAVLSNTLQVLCEVNEATPAAADILRLPADRIDLAFASERPPVEYPEATVDAAAQKIGDQIAALIKDGDCLQTGIGAIPAAVLGALGDKNDLGMHSGLIDDAGMRLIQSGNITGARKEIDQRQHVAALAIGSRALYEWVAETPAMSFRSAAYTHEVAYIRQLSGFVSVNSAVEIDLYGQVNAEMVGSRQISGTGGSVDFMRAAAAAPRGKSIVAMLATARGGQTSRIVGALAHGTATTAARTDLDYVVTEFGNARLKGLPLDARADVLIELAAPPFRDALRAQWQALRG